MEFGILLKYVRVMNLILVVPGPFSFQGYVSLFKKKINVSLYSEMY